jgi:transposase
MKKREISIETKLEVVMAVLRKEEPMSAIAKRYGVAESLLHKWRDRFVESGKEGLKSKRLGANDAPKSELARLEREIAERDRLIGEITIANNILKKRTPGWM